MANEYDDMLAEPTQATQGNEYEQLADSAREEQKSSVQQSMYAAANLGEPDKRAKILELSKRTNLPPNVVERNFDDVVKKDAIANTDYDQIIDKTPGLAKFLEDPDNATLAKDDLNTLGRIDQATRMIKPREENPDSFLNFPSQVGHAFKTGFMNLNASRLQLGAAYGLISPQDAAVKVAEANKAAAAMREKMPDYAKEFQAISAKESGDVAQRWHQFTSSFGEMRDKKILDGLKDFAVGGIGTVGELADYLAAAAVRPRGLIYSTAENLAASAPSLVTGTAGAATGAKIGAAAALIAGQAGPQVATPEEVVTVPLLATIGGTVGFVSGSFLGQVPVEVGSWMNDAMQKRGVDITDPDQLAKVFNDPKMMAEMRGEAERKGLTTAAVDAIFNAFTGKFAAGLSKEAGVLAKTTAKVKDVGVQMGGEFASEYSGQVAAVGSEKADFAESLQEGIMSLGHSYGETIVGGAKSSRQLFSKKTSEAATEVVAKSKEAIQVQHDVQVMGELGQAVKESKLAKRMPEKIQQLVNAAHPDGEAASVFFQADDWDSYWTKKGQSPAKAAENILGDSGKAYVEAKETGAPLEIPLGKYVEKVAPTEDYEGLLPATRTTPEGMSFAEAREHLKSLPATMQDLADEAAGKQAEPLPSEATQAAESAKKVKENVVEQLKALGQDQKTAETNAALYEQGFKALGERAGIDPQKLFEQYQLKINGEQTVQTGPIQSDEQILNQGPSPKRSVLFPVKQKDGVFTVEPRDDMKVTATLGAESMQITDVKYNEKYLGVAQDMVRSIERQAVGAGSKEISASIPNDEKLVKAFEAQGYQSSVNEDGTVTVKKDLTNQVALNQSAVQVNPELSPLGFYSQTEAEIAKMDFNQMPAKDLLNRINNIQGLKKEELEFNGLADWLAAKEGKVTKAEVQQFLKDNGVKVEQVVLSEDHQDAASNAANVEWSELERTDLDGYELSEAISNEVGNNMSDKHWVRERHEELHAQLVSDFTDESGDIDEQALEEKIQEVMQEEAEKSAEEYIRSDDYYGARYEVSIVGERNLTLSGSDEYGWMDSDGKDYGNNLEEAKIQYLGKLIEDGVLEGNVGDLIREEQINWNSPTAAIAPAQQSVTKKTNALWKANSEKYLKEEYDSSPEYYDKMEPAERKTTLEENAKGRAKDEARESYNDPNNPKNNIQVSISHALLSGQIEGNNVRGWQLNYESQTVKNNRFDLEAKNLEDAKKEALAKMIENGAVQPKKTVEPGADVNTPSGPPKWAKYTVPGGENYREVLLTLPKTKDGGEFKYTTHFDEKNILAHVRLTDRVDGQGRKTLFIEEVQSDWHQQGRERGYKQKLDLDALGKKQYDVTSRYNALRKEFLAGISDKEEKSLLDVPITEAHDNTEVWNKLTPEMQAAANEWLDTQKLLYTNAKAVADAPFKNTEAWAALAMKRMIRLAVEQGYSAVAWTPAQVHVERWGTDSISWVKKPKINPDEFTVVRSNSRISLVPKSKKVDGVKGWVKVPNVDWAAKDFKSEEDLNKFLQDNSQDHWLVGSAEQRGGNADGVNIEELARQRGQLLERNGQRVTTREELKAVVAETLGREKTDRSLESLTERVWKGMQAEDQHTGAVRPRAEGMEFFYNKMLPDVTKKILKKLDPNAKIEVTTIEGVGKQNYYVQASKDGGKYDIVDKNDNIVKPGFDSFGEAANIRDELEAKNPGAAALEVPITDALKAEVQKGFTLFQENRGQIRFGNDRTFNIDLLKNADPSTFIHETGHFYLEVLGDLADKADASEQIKGDHKVILDWLGVTGRHEITREHHEKFARGFEAYLMEGKAPSQSLRQAFARFKVWLTSVYRQIKNLNVELSDDVRNVFNRLLATDEEINQAETNMNFEPLFVDPKQMGMSDEQAARYIEAREEARMAAEDTVTQKLMNDYRRSKRTFYKQERAAAMEQIEAQLNQQNIYKAMAILQRGEMADGSPLPEGMQAIKLDRAQLVEDYGPDFVKNRLPKPYVYAREGGLHPDVAAELLGFENGDALVTQLANTPPKGEAIKTMADQYMAEKYPDLLVDDMLPDEAIKAVHNDKRAHMLRMELAHLASENITVLKDVIRRVVRRVPSEKAVREQATKTIGSKRVEELKPHLFLAAERKAAKQAGEALARGDIDAAFEAKRKELYNHELYRAAVGAKDNVAKQVKNFKKLFKADEDISKTRDVDMVNAGRAILAEFGITKSDKTAIEYLSKMQQYDPDTYDTISALVDSATQVTGPYKKISYDDFVAMSDAVMALWDLSKTSREIEIDGVRMDREQVKEELAARLGDLTKPGERAGYDRAATTWDKAKMGLMGIRAALRRVESWADAMDSGDIKGKFRTYMVNPIMEATARYRVNKKKVVLKYLDIVKSIEKTIDRKEIVSPELGYKFKNKGEVLGAMLHMGNESNMAKLLVGRGWGEVNAEGIVDRSRFKGFLDRLTREGTLTKADYDFVQNVWDLFDEMKADAQKAHKRMYGYYFNEVTANEFETPFGSYRGGYAPAVADPFVNMDAAIREEKEALTKSNNSFMFPTAGRGFTKSRVENYRVPLSMDLNLVPMHIDKVQRFVHIEPAVKEVSRVVMDKGFRKVLDAFDPTVGGDMLVPWLQRSAQQKVTTPTQGWGGKALDTFFKEVRKRTGLQVMTLNVVNALQQTTGLTIALTKVQAKHMRNALWDYMKAPKKTAAMVAEKSEYMNTKITGSAMEIQQQIDEMLLNPTKYEQAREFAQKHGYFLQAGTQNIVDTIVWSGAYNQAVEQGHDEKTAVRSADAAVRATQGSLEAENVSRFETGTPFMRAFTQFYSYFNMQANLLGTEFIKANREMGLRKGAGRMLYVYTMGFMIPAVLSEALVRAAGGKGFDEDDDDQYLDDAMNIFFGSQWRGLTALLPGIGPAVNSGINAFNDKWYDDRITTSPAVSMLESAVHSPKSVYDAIHDKRKSSKAVKDTLTALGLLTGLPVAPLARPIGYATDVATGQAKPTGPIDFTRGLVTGKKGK